MKDAGVGLEHLRGREVARNRGVGAQRHCDGRRCWAEELGQISGGVRKLHALSPGYQGDNLYNLVIDLFYKSEEILYFLQF